MGILAKVHHDKGSIVLDLVRRRLTRGKIRPRRFVSLGFRGVDGTRLYATITLRSRVLHEAGRVDNGICLFFSRVRRITS